jgi:hypothetical protein
MAMGRRSAARISLWIGAACALAFAVLAAHPPKASSRPVEIHPFALLARTPGGTPPNAPASEPALSGDSRVARYAAYTSAATDIVPGSGAHRNVYLVERAAPWGENGTPWEIGATQLVTRGLGGRPADGDSWGPAFDGFEYVGAGGRLTVAAPRCIAFVSAASNLVRGDRDGHADVFVRRLPNGPTTRIATPAAATEVDLDGRCQNVAYIAGGKVYVARADGRGRPTRASTGAGANSLTLDGNAHVAVFGRDGWVYMWHLRHGTRRVTRGDDPSANVYGQYVAFTRGTTLLQVNLFGRPHVTPVLQSGAGPARGAEPSMSFGHAFVFYTDGPFVRLNTFQTLMGACNGGRALDPATSPHGNYVAFACSTGQVYLSYVGPK